MPFNKLMRFILFLFFCLNSLQSQSKNLFNKNQPEVNTFGNSWEFVSDKVMGGLSEGQYQFLSQKNDKFYRLNGNVTTENNGGFIQFRSKLKLSDSKYRGLKIKVRGNKGSYSVHVRTKYTILPWQYYSHNFKVSDKWKVVEIPFESFEKSHSFQPSKFKANNMSSIAFVAIGFDFAAKLDILEASFY